jgi:hypothetical protein
MSNIRVRSNSVGHSQVPDVSARCVFAVSPAVATAGLDPPFD